MAPTSAPWPVSGRESALIAPLEDRDPAGPIAAVARAVAFARFVTTQHSYRRDMADLIVTGDRLVEKGDKLYARS
jgi:hypothetical protein